ncbi:hypothetical protein LguiB_028778 [Lonicera macranthoides]
MAELEHANHAIARTMVNRATSVKYITDEPIKLDSLRDLRLNVVEEMVQHVKLVAQRGQFLDIGKLAFTTALNQMVVSLMISSLVYHFHWKLPFDMTSEKIDINDKFGLTLQKENALVAVPTPKEEVLEYLARLRKNQFEKLKKKKMMKMKKIKTLMKMKIWKNKWVCRGLTRLKLPWH